MHATHTLIIVFFCATTALAQAPPVDEAMRMRATTLGKRYSLELPAALPQMRSHVWQAVTPKVLRRSMRPPLVAESTLAPRLASADRGYTDRPQIAQEKLDLGLSADPPRPEFPLLAAAARPSAATRSALEIYQLPPLSRSAEPPLALVGDPATTAARPHTAPVATASRGAAPPRSDIGIPDPFTVQREVQLPEISPDLDPPALSFSVPERPPLPVEEVKK